MNKIVVIVLLVFSVAFSSQAQSGEKSIPEEFATSRVSLSQLKAVIIVGPVEDLTVELIEEATQIALFLRDAGVAVAEFYHPNAKWDEIVKATNGANIFIYKGHGTTLGPDGASGGFVLSNESFINTISIESDLNLSKNALVIFSSVCRAAGSSAGDDADIGIDEAVQRVSDYSSSFFKEGAGGYFASSSNNTIEVLRMFFNKKNLNEIYEETLWISSKTEFSGKYLSYPKFMIVVSSSPPEGTAIRTSYINGVKTVQEIRGIKEYDHAYVGDPNFTVDDMFKE